MKIQWDKVPERIHSESLRCFFCEVMSRMFQKSNDYKASMTLCCSLMIFALTIDNDEAFESEEKLRKAFSCKKYLLDPLSEDETSFVIRHTEYFFECTSRVLKSVNNCPDKPYDLRRSE